MQLLTIIIAVSTILAQSPQQMASTPSMEDVSKRFEAMNLNPGTLPQEVRQKDEMIVWQSLSKGSADHLTLTSEGKLDAGIATWAALRFTAGGPIKSRQPLLPSEFTQMMSAMRQLIVESEPPGASVTVDGYRWENVTRAEGFAQMGQRNLVVATTNVEVSFKCYVRNQRVTTATVDLSAKAGNCR